MPTFTGVLARTTTLYPQEAGPPNTEIPSLIVLAIVCAFRAEVIKVSALTIVPVDEKINIPFVEIGSSFRRIPANLFTRSLKFRRVRRCLRHSKFTLTHFNSDVHINAKTLGFISSLVS